MPQGMRPNFQSAGGQTLWQPRRLGSDSLRRKKKGQGPSDDLQCPLVQDLQGGTVSATVITVKVPPAL